MSNGFSVDNVTNERVMLYDDGKYRWLYRVKLFKDPTVFLLILKIFLSIVGGVFCFVILVDTLNTSDFYSDRLLTDLRFFAYILIGTVVLCALGYSIYAAMMGGSYDVVFVMDETGVLHSQAPYQAKKARKLGLLTSFAGLAAGKPSVAAAGAGAQRTESYSEFAKVKKVRTYSRRGLIKLNETLNRNQVYVKNEDFAFVENFILVHCPNINK